MLHFCYGVGYVKKCNSSSSSSLLVPHFGTLLAFFFCWLIAAWSIGLIDRFFVRNWTTYRWTCSVLLYLYVCLLLWSFLEQKASSLLHKSTVPTLHMHLSVQFKRWIFKMLVSLQADLTGLKSRTIIAIDCLFAITFAELQLLLPFHHYYGPAILSCAFKQTWQGPEFYWYVHAINHFWDNDIGKFTQFDPSCETLE